MIKVTQEQNTNHDYIDVLRFLACFAVILLHYSGSYTYRFDIPTFKTGVLFFTATRWCVPVFLMVSGALLLGKNYEIIEFYKKRFIRIIPPFLFWSFVYITYKIYNHESTVSNIPQLLLEGAQFHLWYVYLILGLILFLPFITNWTEKRNLKSIIIFLIIWAYWLISKNDYKQFDLGIDLTYFSGYLGYMVLGYYLHIISSKSYQWLIGCVLCVSGFLYSYYSSIDLSDELKQFSEYNQRYLSWNVLLMSGGVFLIIKQIKIPKFGLRVIKEVAKYSFTIYLSHIFLRDNLVKNYFDFVQLDSYSFLLVKTIMVLICSYVIAKILRMLPFVGPIISG